MRPGQVGWVYLTNELTAASTRWKDVHRPAFIPPHSNDTADLVLASGHHRRDRGVLSAEPGPRRSVNADTVEEPATRCDQDTSDIAKQPVSDTVRVEKMSGSLYEILI